MAAPCLLLPGDGNAFPDGERGTLHVQWTSRLHRRRCPNRLMTGLAPPVRHRHGRHPLRSEPTRRPAVVVGAPAVGLSAAAAMLFFRPYTRVDPAGLSQWMARMVRFCGSAVAEPCYCCLGSSPSRRGAVYLHVGAVSPYSLRGLPGRVTGCAGDGLGSVAPPVGKLGHPLVKPRDE